MNHDIPVGQSPSAVSVNPNRNLIYVANIHSVSVIDGYTNSVSNISLGLLPSAVSVNPITNVIYVANSGSNTVFVPYFLVNTINRLQRLPDWNSTVIIITYDDSGAWYDHVLPPIVSQSNDPNDRLLGNVGLCGHTPAGSYQDRCGYGPRLPLLIISPYAKTNFIDHGITDQSSILRFIEDNWSLGRIVVLCR